MAELPIIQTREKIKAHPELAELLDAAAWIESTVNVGRIETHPYLVRRGVDPTGRFSAYWDIPTDIRERDRETGELLHPTELEVTKFAAHFAHSALTLCIRHLPERPPMPSVGPRRFISFPQVSFTIGHHPQPDQHPFSKEWSPSATFESRGPLAAREELYMSVHALDDIGRPVGDPERDSGVREFSEMFFRLPAQLGLYDQALRRHAQRESFDARSANAS